MPIAVISAWISLLERTLSIRLFSTLMILPRSGSTAWVFRSRPCFAEPPAESPSTMNSSASAGSLTEQSASLPGSVEFSSADLRRVRSRALRAASRARAASTALTRIRRASAGCSSRNSPSCAVDDLLDQALDRRVAELGLGLALELRVGELHRDHRRQPLADVLAGEVLVLVLEQARGSGRSALSVRVSAERKPERWVPPSWVLMLLAKLKMDSW